MVLFLKKLQLEKIIDDFLVMAYFNRKHLTFPINLPHMTILIYLKINFLAPQVL